MFYIFLFLTVFISVTSRKDKLNRKAISKHFLNSDFYDFGVSIRFLLSGLAAKAKFQNNFAFISVF